MKKLKLISIILLALFLYSCENKNTKDNSIGYSKTTEYNKKTIDVIINKYENFVDQYIAVMKKATQGDDNAICEGQKLSEKAKDIDKKLEDTKSNLTTAQLKRYTKIQEKMLRAATHIVNSNKTPEKTF